MTRFDATCRICKRPLVVEVDPSFTASIVSLMGTTWSFRTILAMACHNRCADLHDKRKITVERIQKAVDKLRLTSVKDLESRERSKTTLTILMKTYARVLCDQAGAPDLVIPVDEPVDRLMESPHKADTIIKAVRAGVRHAVSQQEFVTQ